MISPLASYDFAANKLMFSQLFPYIPLFNLCTGYILTISPLASYVFAAILDDNIEPETEFKQRRQLPRIWALYGLHHSAGVSLIDLT